MSSQACDKAAGCPALSPFAAVMAPLDDAQASDSETLSIAAGFDNGHHNRPATGGDGQGAAVYCKPRTAPADANPSLSADGRQPARPKAAAHHGGCRAGANRRKAAERLGRQKKRETLLELQERLKKAQQRKAALTSSLTAEEAQREALQARLGDLKEECTRAYADTQRLMEARRHWLAQANHVRNAPIAAESQGAAQHLATNPVTSGHSNFTAPPCRSGYLPGALVTSSSQRERTGSPAFIGIPIKAEALPCAAAGPSGGTRAERGFRAQNAVQPGVPHTAWLPPGSAGNIVTPSHMTASNQRSGGAAAAATDGHQPWERWSAGECAAGMLGLRSGSDFLAGDVVDELFLREMSLLEPMPSLTDAF